MLENEIVDLFKAIFDIKKVTLEEPGEALEQGVLFISVDSYTEDTKNGFVKGVLRGNAKVYSQSNKLPLGFFTRKLRSAGVDLTRDLFCTDFEMNLNVFQNLIERSFSFTYFYTSEYDPEQGSLTEIVF